MVVQFYNLQFHLAKADNAQSVQNQFMIQDRAGQEHMAARTQDSYRDEATTVDDSTEPEHTVVHEDGGGQRGWHRSRYQQEGDHEDEAPTPPHPDGTGRLIDIVA